MLGNRIEVDFLAREREIKTVKTRTFLNLAREWAADVVVDI